MLRVLVVEDVELDAELMAIELRRLGHDLALERVDTGPALRAALETSRWDIVLCDHSLPSFESREALAIVQAVDAELPVVILSGTIGEEATVEALRAGARDVVLKSNLARLGPVIDRELHEADNRRRRHRAEEALRDSEARKTAILETAIDCLITIDHDGRIVDFNPAAEQTFGYRRESVVGKPLAETIIPPALREHHRAGLARCLATGESAILGRRIELTGMRADGSEFPIELAIARGELAGQPFFTGYLRDLTERKALEAQLRQAHKMDAIGAMASGIAHDFNNLLTIVLGYGAHALRQLGPDDPVRPNIEQMQRAAERGSALIRQLLIFGRQQELQPGALDVNDVVRGVEPMLRGVIRDDVELAIGLASHSCPVRADRNQLEQVLVNLVVNARDAMPDGGTVAIGTRGVELDRADLDPYGPASTRRYVALSVHDTGVGMDAETRARIFEPFFTTKAPGSGTGLGLASVFGIVTQSAGFVNVDSVKGQGATFTVHLPLHHEAPEPARAPADSGRSGPRPRDLARE